MAKPSDFPSKFKFDPRLGTTGRYVDSRRRMVSRTGIIAEAEKAISGVKGEMRGLALQLQGGQISAQEWYDGMRQRLKIIHGLEASVAKGGWAQMTPSDWGAVGAITKQQYKYLNNFTLQILDGTQPLDGRFIVRAGMYADASRGTAEDMLRRQAAINGYTEERRVLGVADHCQDCVDAANQGWRPIGTLPRIGDSVCRTNCHCTFEYR